MDTAAIRRNAAVTVALRPVRSLRYEPTARPAKLPRYGRLAAHTSSSLVNPLAIRRKVGSHNERPHHTCVSRVCATMRVVRPFTFIASRRLRQVFPILTFRLLSSQSTGPSGVSWRYFQMGMMSMKPAAAKTMNMKFQLVTMIRGRRSRGDNRLDRPVDEWYNEFMRDLCLAGYQAWVALLAEGNSTPWVRPRDMRSRTNTE